MMGPKFLLAACLVFPAAAFSQDKAAPAPSAAEKPKTSKAAPKKIQPKPTPTPPETPKPGTDDLDESQTLKDSYTRQRDGIKDLGVKQDAAEAAVENDKTLNRAQRKAKLAAIQKDFRLRRNALRDKFVEERKKLRSEHRKDFWRFRKKPRGAQPAPGEEKP